MTQQERVAARAYELWLRRGGGHGGHEADWLQAEEELKRFTVVLTGAGENKIGVLKELRTVTGLELPQARALMERICVSSKEEIPTRDLSEARALLRELVASG